MLSKRSDQTDYEEQARMLLAASAERVQRHPSGYAYLLAGADDLLHGELAARAYAAQGGIRVQARRTEDAVVAVDIDIPPGWHINSHQPLQKNLIPTELSVTSGWRLTSIDYPPGERQSLGFQSEPLSLYQGNIRIEAKLDAATAPAHVLPLALRLQACNDRVCLPPETVRLQLSRTSG